MNNEAVFEIKNPQDVIDFILNAGIIQVPPYESERQGDSLYIPTFDMLLTPSVSQMTENSVVIEFNMYIKKFEKQLYECSVGMGKDMKSAVGMSVASFLISFINTLSYMHDKNSPRRITTESSGKTLNWDAYLGNIVAMGEEDSSRKDQDDTVYWEILKDEIKKNLGDQKLSYVKVYAAKYSGDVVGEVHVDNAEIPELSEKVKTIVEKWDVQQYRSEKQFFFIEQES